jgi:hypothetical protein
MSMGERQKYGQGMHQSNSHLNAAHESNGKFPIIKKDGQPQTSMRVINSIIAVVSHMSTVFFTVICGGVTRLGIFHQLGYF